MDPNRDLFAHSMSQFAVCRQPWNAYISQLTKEDSAPYAAPLFDKPAYRGRKIGKEGWLFGQRSQLHYHMYSDERLFANLQRWRQGDTVGDVAMQQFRNTQPFNLDAAQLEERHQIDPESYMKLNYKNAAMMSRYLSRAGTMYPRDVMPLSPEAFVKLRTSRVTAVGLGLYPRWGNPFWHRSQQYRPMPHRDSYDPLSRKTKDVMEQYAFNWLQTDRIRRYFQAIDNANSHHRAAGAVPFKNKNRIRLGRIPVTKHYDEESVAYSSKNPTVPGLMSVSGMKKKVHNMYSKSSQKRMGFGNPLLGIRKL